MPESSQKIKANRTVSTADPSPPLVRRRSLEGDSADERKTIGRAARKDVPLDAHAEWTPASDRPDPVALLIEQGETRPATNATARARVGRAGVAS